MFDPNAYMASLSGPSVKSKSFDPNSYMDSLDSPSKLAGSDSFDPNAYMQKIASPEVKPQKSIIDKAIGASVNYITKKIVNKDISGQSFFVDALEAADNEMFKATGKHIAFGESYRSSARQKEIRKKFGYTSDSQPSGYNGLAKAAPPGTSFHEKGLAVDISNYADAAPYLKKYGIVNGLKGDMGHFSIGEMNPGALKDKKTVKSGGIQGAIVDLAKAGINAGVNYLLEKNKDDPGVDFGTPKALADYVIKNGITDLNKKNWWNKNPNKKEAWNIIRASQGKDPLGKYETENTNAQFSTYTGTKATDETGFVIGIPFTNIKVNTRQLNPLWTQDDETNYQNELARSQYLSDVEGNKQAMKPQMKDYMETVGGKILQGLTGGVVKYNNPKEDVATQVGGWIVETGAAIASMGKLAKTAAALPGISSLANSSNVAVSKFVYPAISNALGWGAYGQLDQDLQWSDRLERFIKDAGTGAVFAGSGLIKSWKISVPASFGLGYGLAKLDGATDKDAALNGAFLALMDGYHRYNSKITTAIKSSGEISSDAGLLLKQRAASVLGVTEDTPIAEIKQKYRDLIVKNHPDKGGSVEAAAKINSAYEILTGKDKVINNITETYQKSKEVVQQDVHTRDNLQQVDVMNSDLNAGTNKPADFVAQQRQTLVDLQQSGKKTVLKVGPDENPTFQLDTFKYSDGKIGVSFDIDTEVGGSVMPFTGKFDTEKEAIDFAAEKVHKFITQTYDSTDSDLVKKQLNIISDEVSSLQFGGMIDNHNATPEMQSVVNTPEHKYVSNAIATGEPVIIDPDEFKKIHNDYTDENHPIYSAMAKRAYSIALKQAKNPIVKFTGGGSGSGKSELLLDDMKKGFDGIIVDGTLANYDSVVKKINKATAAGKKVRITAVLPRIESAWKFVQKRELLTGRGVPLEKFVKLHVGFVNTLKKLIEGHPDLNIRLKDTRNAYSKQQALDTPYISDHKQLIDILNGLNYDKAELVSKLQNVHLSEKATRKALAASSRLQGRVRQGDGETQPGQQETSGGVNQLVEGRRADTGRGLSDQLNEQLGAIYQQGGFPEAFYSATRGIQESSEGGVGQAVKRVPGQFESVRTGGDADLVYQSLQNILNPDIPIEDLIVPQKALDIVNRYVGDLTDVEYRPNFKGKDGERKLGAFIRGINEISPKIIISGTTEGVHKTTPYHEIAHLYFREVLTEKQRGQLLARVKKHYPKLDDSAAEERLVQDFAEDVAGQKRIGYKGVIHRIMKWVRGFIDKIRGIYSKARFEADILKKKRAKGESKPGEVYQRFTELKDRGKKPSVTDIGVKIPEKPFVDTGELTTKILSRLEGKTTVSRQFIEDLTNSGDVKQVEKDLIRGLLQNEDDKISVEHFANKVKAELLPLKTFEAKEPKSKNFPSSGEAKYENIVLSDELRGEVANYRENIYQSPVSTSAGDVHFFGVPGANNYFGHTRIEDMADGQTRRIIEVQSDLYQKGRLENEVNNIELTELEESGLNPKEYDRQYSGGRPIMQEAVRRKVEVENKLSQYNDPTAHFRMVREELKRAAQDGKQTVLFPTGKTAMNIEGLGDERQFYNITKNDLADKDNIHIGDEIRLDEDMEFGNDRFIITDVLGDGKFKAVQKFRYDAINDPSYTGEKIIPDNIKETFDISGKVDTGNPIYKFYEKELGRYLKNNYEAVQITDKQGVNWYAVNMEATKNRDLGSRPVFAFKTGGAENVTPGTMSDRAGLRAKAAELKIETTENQIKDIYKAAGWDPEVPGSLKAERALYEVYSELELSQPGSRWQLSEVVDGRSEKTGEWTGSPSTFPKWIPEDLRSKELFDKVMGGLEIDNLKFPDKNKTRQRYLYNLLLEQVDRKLGVSTKAQRETIIQLYDERGKGKNSKSVNRSLKGSERGIISDEEMKSLFYEAPETIQNDMYALYKGEYLGIRSDRLNEYLKKKGYAVGAERIIKNVTKKEELLAQEEKLTQKLGLPNKAEMERMADEGFNAVSQKGEYPKQPVPKEVGSKEVSKGYQENLSKVEETPTFPINQSQKQEFQKQDGPLPPQVQFVDQDAYNKLKLEKVVYQQGSFVKKEKFLPKGIPNSITANTFIPARQNRTLPPTIAQALFADNEVLKDLSMWKRTGFTTASPIRAAEEMDGKRFGIFKKEFLFPIQDADKAFQIEVKQKQQWIEDLFKGLNKAERIAVTNIAEERQPEKGEKPMPAPRPELVEIAKKLREDYDILFNRINAARKLAGKEPMLKRKNYITHYQELTIIEDILKMVGLNMTDVPNSMLQISMYTKPGSPYFKFAKRREADLRNIDAKEAALAYLEPSMRVIHFSGPMKQARDILEYKIEINSEYEGGLIEKTSLFGMRYPNAYAYWTDYLNSLAGKRDIIDKVFQPFAEPAGFVAKLFAPGSIGGNLSTALKQLGSFRNTAAETGLFSIKGQLMINTPQGYKFYKNNSRIGLGRSYEPSTKTQRLFGSKILAKTHGAISQFISIPVGVLDKEMVGGSFLSGYYQGKAYGLTEEEAIRFGDDVAERTQASANMVDRAPINRGKIKTMFGQFQTFVYNEWSQMKTDIGHKIIMGEKSRQGYTEEGLGSIREGRFKGVKRLIGMAFATLAISAMYDELGLPNPFKNDSEYTLPFVENDQVNEVARYLMGSIPYVSNVKFGGSPVVQGSYNVAIYLLGSEEQRKDAIKKLQSLGMRLIPGGGQLSKTWDAANALLNGGEVKSSNGEKVNFVIDINDRWEVIKALAFGKYQTKAGQAYLSGDKLQGLSEKAKSQILELRQSKKDRTASDKAFVEKYIDKALNLPNPYPFGAMTALEKELKAEFIASRNGEYTSSDNAKLKDIILQVRNAREFKTLDPKSKMLVGKDSAEQVIILRDDIKSSMEDADFKDYLKKMYRLGVIGRTTYALAIKD